MHASCIYLEGLSFYPCMQSKVIAKCITLMISRGKDIPCISDTVNMVEICH